MVGIKGHKVFYETKHAIEDGYEIVIHKGGTGSGKTYEIVMYLLLCYVIKNPDKVITIISESVPHLKIGVKRYIDGFLSETNLLTQVKKNETDKTYILPNRSVIELISADRLTKAIGARRDLLYGNEINSLKKDIWDELSRRSKHIIADFNPTAKFWLEDWLQYHDNYTIIKSNYLDNRELPEHEVRRIEKRIKMDANFKRIHIDCEYGVSEGLVFENWHQTDTMPERYDNEWYGLDFGFTNSYTSLVQIRQHENKLFVKELFYVRNKLNSEIIQLISQSGLKERHDTIYADSAEPKTIEEIYRAGYNIKPANEAKKNVNDRIDKLKTYDLYVTKDSLNLIRELRSYRWEQDKNGHPTNKPIKVDDHAIDSLGYGIEELLRNRDEIFIL